MSADWHLDLGQGEHPVEDDGSDFNFSNKTQMKSVIAASLAFLPLLSPAQTSKDLALMGATSWSALECSTLASVMKDEKEQARLFTLGYESGKKFMGAVQAKKVTLQDLQNEVPSGLLMLMQGPSVDFMLGRVFESALDNATRGIFTSNGELHSDELQRTLATTKFGQKNCRLLR